MEKRKVTYRIDADPINVVEILDLDNVCDREHYKYIMDSFDIRKVERVEK